MKKWIYSGIRQELPSEREVLHGRLARKAAAEGIVLLKNEGILPLKKNIAVAVLGCGAEKTVKGGIGSGDVNNRKNVSIYQGLKEAGVKIVSKDWISDYHNRYEQAREAWKEKVLEEAKKVDNPFDAYADNPFEMPLGREVREEDICQAEAIIYVISRISGEGKDRRKVKGDYYLSTREAADLRYFAEMNKPVILILNAGGPVELTEILEQTHNIKGILNISQLGQEGGDALADVLLGKEVPSGKLTTTWARHYEDYPSSEEYGYLNGNLEKEEYKEGIFVGYRYFDSFGKKPLFPFGFGLSYTSFEIKCCGLKIEESKIRTEVQVTNTGNKYAGKEVVQIYTTFPRTDFEKEYITPDMTEYEKVEKVAWYVGAFSDYESGNSSPYSLLIRGKGDCMASRIAVEMLCKQIGIKAVACINFEYHGKTLVKIGGTYYMVVTGYDEPKPRGYLIYEVDETQLEKIMEDNRIFPIDFN